MSPLQSAIDDIHAAEVALRAGHKTLAVDLLRDALDTLDSKPKLILVTPDVNRCEALERELEEI